MADLIDSTRAKVNILSQDTFTAAEDDAIAALITSVSQAIVAYTRNPIFITAYDELYDGTGHEILQLDHYPITAVTRVATNPMPLLRARNTSSSVQRATVAVTSTGLTLSRVASGITSTSTLAFATYPTLAALAAAITALANGWEGMVAAGFELWASTDIRSLQGPFPAKNTYAEISVFAEDVASFQIDTINGRLLTPARTGWPTDNIDNPFTPIWSPGPANYRIVYSAGHTSTTAPADIQQAAADWVAQLFQTCKRDNSLVQSQQTGIGSFISLTNREPIPKPIANLLAPYRRHSLGRARR